MSVGDEVKLGIEVNQNNYFRSGLLIFVCVFFFFNDTATTEIYTLSLHDALPISIQSKVVAPDCYNSW